MTRPSRLLQDAAAAPTQLDRIEALVSTTIPRLPTLGRGYTTDFILATDDPRREVFQVRLRVIQLDDGLVFQLWRNGELAWTHSLAYR